MSQPSDSVDIDQSELDEVSKTYIVILKLDDNGLDSESIQDKHWKWVKERDNNGLDSGPEWDGVQKYESLGGYQAKLSEAAIKDLKERSEVAYVVQDRFGTFSVDDDPPVNITSSDNAPWNLQRLSSTAPPDENANPEALTYTYRRPEVAVLADKPVHVYILDSGITTNHQEFKDRQVSRGPNCSNNKANNNDEKGHGTHVAGTVGGNQCGVARGPGVRITGIKVGSQRPTLSGATQGLEWVLQQQQANPGIPAVINMSLAFSPAEDALDESINRLVARGVHAVVAAGNWKKDATSLSPARAAGALAVGASNIRDEFCASWNATQGSNFGSKVAIFAPGDKIMSAGIDAPDQLVSKSGTSMASPLVAGTIACLIQQEGNKKPEDMLKRLQELADESGRVVKGVPADTNTTNRLIWNGVR